LVPNVYATAYEGSYPTFQGRSARGTEAAPSAVQNGDILAIFSGGGYTQTFFATSKAAIAMRATENWTNNAQGTAIRFLTTANGTVSTDERMTIDANGNVGIGTVAPVDKLQVVGDIRVGTSGTNGCIRNFSGAGIAGTCASDARFKKDVTPFGPTLAALTALQPVHFSWRAADFPERHFGTGRTYGLIAQDVEAVLPELVVTADDGYKSVDYSKLPLLTIQAVKELKAENDDLKARLAALERVMNELRATVGSR
jgi:Chaperone of endosialidase